MIYYKYELYTLPKIISMIQENKGDDKILKEVADKAYKVACQFKKVVSKKFLLKYLNDDLPIDALSSLSLKACTLNQENNGGMFSNSHTQWLYNVRNTKLIWEHKYTNQKELLDSLIKQYNEIQSLAFSCINI